MKTPNVNTKISDAVVDRSAMTRFYEEDVKKKIFTIIDGHADETSNLVKKSNLKSSRFRDDLNEQIGHTYEQANTVSSGALKGLHNSQISWWRNLLDETVGKIWKPELPPRAIDENIILKTPLRDNKTLSQGWAGLAGGERTRIELLIRKGLSEGLGEDEIASTLLKGGTFKISKAQAQGLVRTGTTSVLSQVDQSVYKANEKLIQGWQFVAILDSKTSSVCQHHDGEIYRSDDTTWLPPLHWNCRSTTVPVVKSWEDLSKLEAVAQIRKRNLDRLTPAQIAFYDGQTPLKESYDMWLRRQPEAVQLRHLGDYERLGKFREGLLDIRQFTNNEGKAVSISELDSLTHAGYSPDGTTVKFAIAKERLDTIKLYATTPDEIIADSQLQKNLTEYYELQAGELDGTLSLMPYRGITAASKKATRRSVLNNPANEDHLIYDPILGRDRDSRLYGPSQGLLDNNLRLVEESEVLLDKDKEFIKAFVNNLEDKIGINQRAVIADNLRISFRRYRENKEPWGNLKAVLNSQIQFDVTNASDFIETGLRRDMDLIKRLQQDGFSDPVLGTVKIQDLHDNLFDNIKKKNDWEDFTQPIIAKKWQLRFSSSLPVEVLTKTTSADRYKFFNSVVAQIALQERPELDQLAVIIGRRMYDLAGLRAGGISWPGKGILYNERLAWHEAGMTIINRLEKAGELSVDVADGTQKRRIKSRLTGGYVGPYVEVRSSIVRSLNPKIAEYRKLEREVRQGWRLGSANGAHPVKIVPGYKTYLLERIPGISNLPGAKTLAKTKVGKVFYYDTRIPVTSTGSFNDIPAEFITEPVASALDWASQAKYRVDEDYFDFVQKLLYFRDDKGKAEYFNDLNKFKHHIVERGDSYAKFKAMEWHRKNASTFSNFNWVDHRGRVYESGFIGPQSGETYRPFMNTGTAKPYSPEEFGNMRDQIGAVIGGISDALERRKFRGKTFVSQGSLTVIGRQQVTDLWYDDLLEIGYKMRRAKPQDIRDILDSELMKAIDDETTPKVLRFALELSKIDEFLTSRGGKLIKSVPGKFEYTNEKDLNEYLISVALEQDASSSGAQIIAITTKNKQLAELSNVVPTTQKRRLYDEIAASTFRDSRFLELNKKLGLSEKDLRKAAKAQNMVTFYGAGEKTGIMNVEGKLSKVLSKQEGTLVVTAKDRDRVLNEINAQAARYKKLDPDTYNELLSLREQVKDIFNKGQDIGDDMMDQLNFLDDDTRQVVEKMSKSYSKVVTPDDFKQIANIMSEYLGVQVPILKDFTKYFGKLASDYLETTGEKTVPWVTFDGNIVEQTFTVTTEEKIIRKVDGKWTTSIIQEAGKTQPVQFSATGLGPFSFGSKEGKASNIVDAQKARTSFAVNGNHSNDATIVRQFHNWGKKNGIETATIHDAFLTNAADLLKAKQAIREAYADTLDGEPILITLKEMRKRMIDNALKKSGLERVKKLKAAQDFYNQYKEQAELNGMIPVIGKSRVGGVLLTKQNQKQLLLTKPDVLAPFPKGFRTNEDWYGIGP